MYLYSFEKLEVWQNTRMLIKNIYSLTSAFPKSETFGLTNQLRRAVLGINLNIAEGTNRASSKDKARFINQAYSSAGEVLACLTVSLDLELISEQQYQSTRNEIEKITNQLNKLYKAYLMGTGNGFSKQSQTTTQLNNSTTQQS